MNAGIVSIPPSYATLFLVHMLARFREEEKI